MELLIQSQTRVSFDEPQGGGCAICFDARQKLHDLLPVLVENRLYHLRRDSIRRPSGRMEEEKSSKDGEQLSCGRVG
jgi:hypothetical protein